jgi:hypothetical protein
VAKISPELAAFLHKLVNHLGAQTMHADVDALANDEEVTPEDGKE